MTSFLIVAALRADDGVSAADVATALGLDLSGMPEPLVPKVFALALAYDFAARRLVLAASTEHTDWLYASAPVSGETLRAATVRAGLPDARLSKLPVVGEAIPADRDFALTGVRFSFAAKAWPKEQTSAVNELLDHVDADVGTLPADGLAAGLSVAVDLVVAGQAQPPLVLVRTGSSSSALAGLRAQASAVVTREMNLALGPVRLQRISLAYTDGNVFFAVDAVLALGPVELSLLGLGFGVSAKLEVSFALRGAGVVLDKPPVKVAGALERRSDPDYVEVLDGLLTVEAKVFALQAAGSYARSKAGWSSMFLFGEVASTTGQGLFGPPAFTVMGLCLGFGVNSTVRVPTVDQLGEFPLVQRLDGGIGGSTPQEVLEKLAGPGGWITPREGQYWGAGGLEFTCFKFIEARALLLVEGGTDWKVMLLGRVTVDLPRNKAASRPLARVVVDLAVAFDATQSLFSMDAVVTPGSYVLDPAAELTGGLSLYIWGEDRTAVGGGKGFVFTLGGYHKDFKRPRYYPDPPRLGWQWSLGDVSIRGEVYAAITDGAFMAGGRLAAAYDKADGIQLQAWFTAWVDAMVLWKPFYFDLSMGISVGVAATVKVLFVRVRVSLEVGVSLDLWGPPIGGNARIKVWFISFSIGIGSGRDAVPAVEWDEFRVQVPAPLAIVPRGGLLADVVPAETRARAESGGPLLVSSAGFVVTTGSVIPASKITLNGRPLWTGHAITIRPMRKTDLVSEHKVTIWRNGTRYDEAEADGWSITAVTQGLPRGLWGIPLDSPTDALNEDGLIPGCGTGIRFEVPQPQRGSALGPVSAAALGVDGLPEAAIPLRDATPVGPRPVRDTGSIAKITDRNTGIGAAAVVSRRTDLHRGLATLGLAPGSDGPLGRYAAMAGTTFTDPPMTTTATG